LNYLPIAPHKKVGGHAQMRNGSKLGVCGSVETVGKKVQNRFALKAASGQANVM